MTERLRTSPYGAYCQGDPRRSTQISSDEGLSTKKTMLVLVVVVGCFAILWPKLFYPMLVQNANSHIKPGPVDRTSGCCDVISHVDADTIKIMSELCATVIDNSEKSPPTPKEIVGQCKKAVLETCGIDISAALQDRISLGHSVKQILEEIRSMNGSLCLKYNFGVSPWKLGVPHRIHLTLDPLNNIRQERPTHLRPGMVHPAFRERGRAIPETDTSSIPRRTGPPPRIVEGRPGPIPGMRPAMGGAGHVVPPPKQANYGFMGVLMPIYTIGFLIFFAYTLMKLVFKKKPDSYVGAELYPPCEPNEQFHKEVFEDNRHYFNRPNKDTSKIVVNAVAALLEEVNQEIETHRKKIASEPSTNQDEVKPNGSLPKEEEQGSVTVMAMETTASSESGKKWSRPDSPVLPHPHPPVPKEPSTPPQQIFLEGALPPQSQLLVADSATETQKDAEDDSPVVLAGKMTLSVISLDSETGTEDSNHSGKKSESPEDDDRRRSSSNISEEFEKIYATDLEDQINEIIEQAENVVSVEETQLNSTEQTERLPEDEVPKNNENDSEREANKEPELQLEAEDNLIRALGEKQQESVAELPVTDIIKEFLSSEENLLLETILAKHDALDNVDNETERKDDQINEETFLSDKLSSETIENVEEGEEQMQPEQKEGSIEHDKDLSDSKVTTTEDISLPSDKVLLQSNVSVSELTPETNNGRNMADLLLQGLLVKDDDAGHSSSSGKDAITSNVSQDEKEANEEEDFAANVLDLEDQIVDDVEYDDEIVDDEDEEEDDVDQDEIRGFERSSEERESVERQMNREESSRNGAGNSETAAENEVSEDELGSEEEDEEIEEIIEYVDNTDEEGEEVVEINGNENIHQNENEEN